VILRSKTKGEEGLYVHILSILGSMRHCPFIKARHFAVKRLAEETS